MHCTPWFRFGCFCQVCCLSERVREPELKILLVERHGIGGVGAVVSCVGEYIGAGTMAWASNCEEKELSASVTKMRG